MIDIVVVDKYKNMYFFAWDTLNSTSKSERN